MIALTLVNVGVLSVNCCTPSKINSSDRHFIMLRSDMCFFLFFLPQQNCLSQVCHCKSNCISSFTTTWPRLSLSNYATPRASHCIWSLQNDIFHPLKDVCSCLCSDLCTQTVSFSFLWSNFSSCLSFFFQGSFSIEIHARLSFTHS